MGFGTWNTSINRADFICEPFWCQSVTLTDLQEVNFSSPVLLLEEIHQVQTSEIFSTDSVSFVSAGAAVWVWSLKPGGNLRKNLLTEPECRGLKGSGSPEDPMEICSEGRRIRSTSERERSWDAGGVSLALSPSHKSLAVHKRISAPPLEYSHASLLTPHIHRREASVTRVGGAIQKLQLITDR